MDNQYQSKILMMSHNAKMLENLGVEASIGKANQEACGVGEAEIGNPYDRVFHGLLMMMVVMMPSSPFSFSPFL